jgi:hypothetical protein
VAALSHKEGADDALQVMALDHYVSQVHLKNFYSPALDGLMYAIRKSDLKRFPTKSRMYAGSRRGVQTPISRKTAPLKNF